MKRGQTHEEPKEQKQTGVMVRRVYPLSEASGKLKKNDVIMAADGA